jgi:ParB-like chromosome segregation protein Spo0J
MPQEMPISEVDRLPKVRLAVSEVRLSDTPRVGGQDDEHIIRLAEAEADLPPIVVHRSSMRVIDGNHRLRAAMLRGDDHIWARLFDGDDAAAFVLGVSLNVSHGLPLTLAERKAAAARIVWSHPQWSDRLIASMTGLAAKTVAGVRVSALTDQDEIRDRLGRDGRLRPIDRVSRRAAAVDLLTRNPHASLRAVAAEVGLSPETVRDVRMRLQRGEDPTSRRQPPGRPARADASEVDITVGRPRILRSVPNCQHDSGPAGLDPDEKAPALGATALRADALRADPMLRYTESGRALIRLLDVHRFSDQTWQKLLETVPAHCADVVASVAYACAQRWARFAEEVARRDDKRVGLSGEDEESTA